ncbi:hypothetical protein [Clostridioides difficile]|uniref:hypothetical protein n=1 Tax=Clostridioides difficile TaxID=1496 RepID=UPI001C1839BA|nr:hypothetical protein [Clostridioides difficile]HBE9109976.1 hypothetical protein [Clostridioides difficile]HBF5457077.1 hypothetical protein [Clostridioides difficile]
MKISDFNRRHIGKAIQLQETRFDTNIDCIITEVETREIVAMYYMQENDDVGYKVITWEDLENGDYKLKLLN